MAVTSMKAISPGQNLFAGQFGQSLDVSDSPTNAQELGERAISRQASGASVESRNDCSPGFGGAFENCPRLAAGPFAGSTMMGVGPAEDLAIGEPREIARVRNGAVFLQQSCHG